MAASSIFEFSCHLIIKCVVGTRNYLEQTVGLNHPEHKKAVQPNLRRDLSLDERGDTRTYEGDKCVLIHKPFGRSLVRILRMHRGTKLPIVIHCCYHDIKRP